jgi:hypothetical protein
VIIDAIAARIAAEAEALHRICPWCCVTLGDDGPFCSPYCAEQYERRLMPRSGVERIGLSRPASPKMVRAMHLAGRATRDRKLWQHAHPLEDAHPLDRL